MYIHSKTTTRMLIFCTREVVTDHIAPQFIYESIAMYRGWHVAYFLMYFFAILDNNVWDLQAA